jgi:hypothetical protein
MSSNTRNYARLSTYMMLTCIRLLIKTQKANGYFFKK